MAGNDVQIKLNSRELATVRAALREWQGVLYYNPHLIGEHFAVDEPLTIDDIDELCERLNLAERNPHA